MLKLFITNVRGNPGALATLLIAFLSLAAGYYLSKPGESILSGALVGAAVSLIVSAVATFFGEAETVCIPKPFETAALADFNERGYYRAESSLEVTLTSPDTITFSMKSTIVKFRENALLKIATVRAPNGLKIEKKVYKIDGLDHDSIGETSIQKDVREELFVTYAVINPPLSNLSDTHTWDCPVDGFVLTMRAPDGFHVNARTLSNRNLDEDGHQTTGCRQYREKRSAFSHQGFVWTIMRIDT